MSRSPYSDQLRDPRWLDRRQEILSAARWRCGSCGGAATQVHHKRYILGLQAWEYGAADLEALCTPCHETVTREQRAIRELIARGSSFEVTTILSLLLEWLAPERGDLAELCCDAWASEAGAIVRLLPQHPVEIQQFRKVLEKHGAHRLLELARQLDAA